MVSIVLITSKCNLFAKPLHHTGPGATACTFAIFVTAVFCMQPYSNVTHTEKYTDHLDHHASHWKYRDFDGKS